MRGRIAAVAASAIAVAAIGVPVAVSSAKQRHDHDRGHHHGYGHGHDHGNKISHVLLISVDGLHQSDLEWYVANHPDSTLAKLVNRGAEYSNAHTPVPSDSDPGMTAQMTGGNPKSTGVYYDVEYNHDVFPPGTPSNGCTGTPPGGDVVYDSPDDRDVTKLDAGQGLTGLPDSIFQMTGNPNTVPPTAQYPFTGLLNPATFPVDPTTCQPIYPHSYLKVNTIMNVIHDAGLRTAWSDKHPVYESFNGPEGNGMDDFFAPEIDSDALHHDGAEWSNPPIAWTGDNAATMQYDDYKVQAVINWIEGLNHQGTQHVGTPAIYGMNFQTVSTAEKLPTSDGLTGGYYPGTDTPGPLLQRALDYIDARVGQMVEEIRDQHQDRSTAIVISAKHGQSPLDPNQLTRIDDGPIIDGINAACSSINPKGVIVAGTDDDAWMSWVQPKTQAAADCVKNYLWTHPATGTTITPGVTRTLQHSGLAKIWAGQGAANFFGVPVSDPRHPDVWGRVQVGVVYTGGTKKIAEHGGQNPGDRDVPILVYAPGSVDSHTSHRWVETTQIAPTILHLLGLDPDQLGAVQIEGTRVLPGL